jgi:hypothetical protein
MKVLILGSNLFVSLDGEVSSSPKVFDPAAQGVAANFPSEESLHYAGSQGIAMVRGHGSFGCCIMKLVGMFACYEDVVRVLWYIKRNVILRVEAAKSRGRL